MGKLGADKEGVDKEGVAQTELYPINCRTIWQFIGGDTINIALFFTYKNQHILIFYCFQMTADDSITPDTLR